MVAQYAIFPSTTPLGNRPDNLNNNLTRIPRPVSARNSISGGFSTSLSSLSSTPPPGPPPSKPPPPVPHQQPHSTLWNPSNSSHSTRSSSLSNPPSKPLRPSPPSAPRRIRRSRPPQANSSRSHSRPIPKTAPPARIVKPPNTSKPLPPPPPLPPQEVSIVVSASRAPTATGKRRRGASATTPPPPVQADSSKMASQPLPLDPPILPSTLRNEDSMSEMSMKLPLQQPSPAHETPTGPFTPGAKPSTNTAPTESAFPIQLPSSDPLPSSAPLPDLEKGAPPASAIRPDTAQTTSSDIPWGPQHPCFPHPNPHVPLSSALYANTRIVRIPRDWLVAGDLAPTFSNVYPQILDPLFPEAEFRRVIAGVNDRLVQIFEPWAWRNVLDAVLGVLTGWVWDDLGLCKARAGVKDAEAFIQGWNRDVGHKEGVEVVGLRRTGFMSLDVQIPVPVVEEVGGTEQRA